MTHPEEQLAGYVDGSLDPAERAGVEAHLEECSTCRDDLSAATAARSALAALPRSVATPSEVGRTAIDGSRRSTRRPPERTLGPSAAASGERSVRPAPAPYHPRWYRWAGAAAGAAAVILALALVVPSLTADGADRAAELAAPGAGSDAQASSAIDATGVERVAGNLGATDLPALADPILAGVQDGSLELAAGADGQPDEQDGQENVEAPAVDTIAEPTGPIDRRSTAAACLRTAFPAVTTAPLRVVQLRFEGTPAYGGVFFVAGGTETEFGTFETDVLQVVVASRNDCSLLGTSPVRV